MKSCKLRLNKERGGNNNNNSKLKKQKIDKELAAFVEKSRRSKEEVLALLNEKEE